MKDGDHGSVKANQFGFCVDKYGVELQQEIKKIKGRIRY